MTPNNFPQPPSTFLLLPREIRDEIFGYLLYCPAPRPMTQPTYPPAHLPTELRYPYHKVRCKNLGLFRVNKQFHEEASEVFYRINVWPIRMVISGSCEETPECFWKVHVTFEAPWEEFAYGVGEGGVGKFYDLERFYRRESSGELEAKEVIMDSKPDLYPAPRYRRLLRRIRVEVIDFRMHGSGGGDYSKRVSNKEEESILIPFMSKMKALLDPAGEEALMNIKLLRDWKAGNGPHDVVTLDTVMPLTKGVWQCYIQTDVDHDGIRTPLKCRILANRGETYRKIVGGKIVEVEEATVVGDCYYAIVGGKVKLVRNGMRYSCCYGCERRELEKKKISLLVSEAVRKTKRGLCMG
ncbi:hypothetical protein TWF506_009832 [Arthrobotrys conoides]|uniref:F-box domain-containing protein n=1 Tax=Arthrobotrys conoides TaxID=74498 RepID=A0AAN8RQK3_9PEZI